MFTKEFGLALAERSLKTFAQALVAVLVGAGTGLLDSDWAGSLSVAGMAAVISVLTNIATGANNGQPAAFGPEKIEEG